MKKWFLIILIFPLITRAQSSQKTVPVIPEKGVKFETDLTWQQILEKAKSENKNIFIDCFATWCGPCKMMDKDVYIDEKVGNYLNDKYISVKIQMDSTKHDNEYIKGWYVDVKEMKERYKVTAFPTYLFLSPTGKILHRDLGYRKSEDFIKIASEALNPDKQYYTLLENYKQSKLDTASMKSLAHKVMSFGETELAEKIANNYINRLQGESLFTVDNIWFMYDFTKSSKERGFALFRDSAFRIYQVEKKLDEAVSRSLVKRIIYNEEIKPYTKSKKGKPDWEKIETNVEKYGVLGQDTYTTYKPGLIFKSEIEPSLKADPEWERILPIIKKQNAIKGEEFLVGSSIVFYLNEIAVYHTEKKCKNLIASALFYIKEYPTYLRADPLNTWAWIVFQNSSDSVELNYALSWSKHALDLNSNDPAYLDTYSNLLYKTNKIQEAVETEYRAAKLEEEKAAEQKRLPDKIYEETLAKMKKGEPTWVK